MELRHLRTLEAIARHGSFTRAAEELHLAQSALSQQVRRMEAELGVELLSRTSRRVGVTAAGQVVLAHARRVLQEVDGLQAELEELTGMVRGKLSIGAMWPTGTYDFPGVLGAFHERHPGVEIHVVEDTADALLALLRADELDCAFASVDPEGVDDDLTAVLLYEESLVVACAEGHPFAGRDHVTYAELAGEALIAYREGSALRRRLERAMAAEGLVPRNALICTEMAAVRALASRGLGVAVLPDSIAAIPGPPVVTRQLGRAPLTWPVALTWRAARRQPPAAKAFLALALESADADASAPPPRLRVA